MSQSAVSSDRKVFHQEARVLSPEDCDYLIHAFEGLGEFWREYRDTFTINYNDLPVTSRSKQMLNRARLSVADVIRREFGETRAYANLTQIVKWPEGSAQPLHKDDPSFTTYSCILNLNDDYEGGRTLLPALDTKIQPSKGQASIFYGCELEHGVEKITRGTRYTIPIWYVDDVSKAEL